ncbi:hypothetical protein SDC9_87934 [bioreactor metagenome]|uniref:Uncharacterized protein n=1 Tax=bioreactor metagenome TaxID=1076179 RepID=A0A644ZUM8_9ZZZZ
MFSPAHPAAKLVELPQAEAFGILHHHQGGVGHVHPHLNHSRRHQHVQPARGKALHRAVFFRSLHAPMDKAHPQVGENLLPQQGRVFGDGLEGRTGFPLLHRRADHVDLTPLSRQAAHEAIHPLPLGFSDEKGLYRAAAWRQLVNHRKIQIAVNHQRQSAGNGRGRHHQNVRQLLPTALLRQRGALIHAEAVLLVGDHQSQPGKGHPLGQKRVRAHRNLHLALGQRFLTPALFRRRQRAGEQLNPDIRTRQQLGKGLEMLPGQQLGGRHHGGLKSAPGTQKGTGCSHGRLARANIPLYQPVHQPSGGHVSRRFVNGPALGGSELKGQGGKIRLQPAGGDDRAGPGIPQAPQHGKPRRQAKELLKYQPPPGLRQRLPGRGRMNGAQGRLRRNQPMFQPHLLRQNLGQLPGAVCQNTLQQ